MSLKVLKIETIGETMKMKYFTLFALLLLTSCGGPRYVDFFPYTDHGIAKPHVVIMPMRVPDHCDSQLASDLMKETRYQLMDNGQIYLDDQAEIDAWVSKKGNLDYFDRDISWANGFKGADYVVVVEAVEHHPYNTYSCGCDLPYVVIKLRLKLIDVRCETPRVILYEMLETTQAVSAKAEIRSANSLRGSHRSVCNKLVTRLQNVIWSVH